MVINSLEIKDKTNYDLDNIYVILMILMQIH